LKRDREEYRALFVADVHMSNRLPYAKPTSDGLTDRLEEQLALWERIYTNAVDRKAQAIFILGDLFDKSLVDAVTLTYTAKVIDHSPVPVYILPGNHDANSIRGGRFTVEAFNHVGGGRVACLDDPAPLMAYPWLRFWPLKFMTADEARGILAAMREEIESERAGVEVLLLHQSIVGCSHYGWLCDDGLSAEEVCEGFDWVFAGHFHTPQTFGPDNRGRYLGAPMHHRFDDEGRPAQYWMITFRKSGKIKAEPIDGGAPSFHTLRWGKGKDPDVAPGDYLRIVVEATNAEYNRLKPNIVERLEVERAAGVRAHAKHKPVYHHTERIESHDDSTVVTTEQAAVSYVGAADVETSGLNTKLLKRIAREILAEARSGT